jgi:hypothetical protein
MNMKCTSIKPAYFLVAAVLTGVVAIYALRENKLEANRLQEIVTTVDQQNGDVEKALQDLRRHVHSHMNTNLVSGSNAIRPPVQLKYRYERLVAAEQDRVKAMNEQITKKAEAICGQQFPAGGFNAPRVACIQDYVAANAVKAGGVADDLYKFDFVSPRWSPDLAGWSLIASTILFVLFIVRFAIWRFLHK